MSKCSRQFTSQRFQRKTSKQSFGPDSQLMESALEFQKEYDDDEIECSSDEDRNDKSRKNKNKSLNIIKEEITAVTDDPFDIFDKN